MTFRSRKTIIYDFFKRFFDISLSIAGIIFLLPIFIIIAILVKTSSRGKILYYGERVGRNGNIFKILKFRSLYSESDEGIGTVSKNDKRITPIGFFIRKYKLDELPQLFNILFGDMSFVGPRPELKKFTNLYNETEKEILSVRPGITDFSTIKFYNLNELIDQDDPDRQYEKKIFPEKNRLRLEYVKNRGFFLDIYLIIKTIKIIIFRK